MPPIPWLEEGALVEALADADEKAGKEGSVAPVLISGKDEFLLALPDLTWLKDEGPLGALSFGLLLTREGVEADGGAPAPDTALSESGIVRGEGSVPEAEKGLLVGAVVGGKVDCNDGDGDDDDEA